MTQPYRQPAVDGAGIAPGGRAAAARLLLTRHGQTTWHAENRYAGADSDVDLTDHGRAQAVQLAEWAKHARPTAVYSSPVRRAQETALPAAAALGVELTLVEDLREVDFGAGNGRTLDELAAGDADMVTRFRDDPVRFPFPGAEPPAQAAARAAAALRGLAAAHADDDVLVVAHNTVLRLAMCLLLDLPVSRYRQLFPRLDNAAVTSLSVPQHPESNASLLSLNVPLLSLDVPLPSLNVQPPSSNAPLPPVPAGTSSHLTLETP